MEDITVSWHEDTERWTVELSYDDLATLNAALIVASGHAGPAITNRYGDLSDRLEDAIWPVSE